ncbi:MAG: hypothetical protein ABIY51_02170 [Ferruginibacter sp.]
MSYKTIHKVLTYCIAVTWIVNGFFYKVLNLVSEASTNSIRNPGNGSFKNAYHCYRFFRTFMAA